MSIFVVVLSDYPLCIFLPIHVFLLFACCGHKHNFASCCNLKEQSFQHADATQWHPWAGDLWAVGLVALDVLLAMCVDDAVKRDDKSDPGVLVGAALLKMEVTSRDEK